MAAPVCGSTGASLRRVWTFLSWPGAVTGDAPPVVAGALLLDAAGRVIGRSGPDSGWVPGVGPGPVTLGERFEPLNPLSAAAAQALSAGLARVLSGQVPSYRQVWQEPGWAGSVQVDRWSDVPGALVSWVDGAAGEPLRALFDHGSGNLTSVGW